MDFLPLVKLNCQDKFHCVLSSPIPFFILFSFLCFTLLGNSSLEIPLWKFIFRWSFPRRYRWLESDKKERLVSSVHRAKPDVRLTVMAPRNRGPHAMSILPRPHWVQWLLGCSWILSHSEISIKLHRRKWDRTFETFFDCRVDNFRVCF